MPKYYKKHLLSGKNEQNYEDFDPVKNLLTWNAPSRPYRKKGRSYYTTAAVLVVLVCLIALIAGQLMLIVALLAFLFLVYVLNFVQPESVTYKISMQGITIGDHFYHWQELDSFWFIDKDGYKILHVLTFYRFPGELMLVLSDELSEEEVKRVCARFIPFHEIAPKSMMDKWSESLQKHFPLETPHR